MAKKKPDRINYSTDATPRAVTPDGVPVFCSFDEIMPVKDLRPNPKNPNQHGEEQVALLAQIIEATGWREKITVSRRSGLVVKGHGRLLAAQFNRWGFAPMEYQEYASEAEELDDLLADNRLAELSSMDEEQLRAVLRELEETGELPMELTGYTGDALSQLLAVQGADDTGDDGVDAKESGYPAVARTGDLWILGEHRLICGDSTDPAVIERLMAGEKAQTVVTDPPYGVEYTGGEGKTWTAIEGDDKTGDDLLARLLLPVFRNYVEWTEVDAAFYIWHSSSSRRDFEDAMTAAGLVEKQYLIWAKNSPTLSHADYQWAHEPCFYAEKAGRHAHFYGDRAQPTVWRVIQRGGDGMASVLTGGLVLTDGEGGQVYLTDKPPKGKKVRRIRLKPGGNVSLYPEEANGTLWQVARESGIEHPTQKPVELYMRALENSSRPGDIVADFFAGSGTILIAAETSGRRCRAAELMAGYCDLIIDRYVRLTGRTENVTCRRDGRTVGYEELIADKDPVGGAVGL